MTTNFHPDQTAGAEMPRRFAVDGVPRKLCVFTAGFLRDRQIRRILDLAGLKVSLGWPNGEARVGVWGQSPYAHRGEAVAQRTQAPLVRIEDAFLRSLHPGRMGGAPTGLLIDTQGVHFDARTPSDLESLLATHPLDDSAQLARAKAAMARMKALELTKYTAFDPDCPPPAPGYVLVIDQTRGDASVTASNADAQTFTEMLTQAQLDHPGIPIVIKTHPESQKGLRAGYFTDRDLPDQARLCDSPVSPWALLDGAIAVYTVSSGMGFEAILAGHKPHVFGQPFYAGWGLSRDLEPLPRRRRTLTRAQLFLGAMMLYPHWYDPFSDQLCGLERVMDCLEAERRAWREDRRGYVAHGMRLWKRGALRKFYGQHGPMRFESDLSKATDQARSTECAVLSWGGEAKLPDDVPSFRVEDGFLRSKGLGAELVPPLSLVRDDLGIYFDPSRESRLERLIAQSETLGAQPRARAERLMARLIETGLSKYNIGTSQQAELAQGHRILVPGQVEDDASIRLGCGDVASNLGLLKAARDANPEAVILYKPHPDVEAGLRPGALAGATDLADHVLGDWDAIAAIEAADEVWTMTSALGFEALIRGRAVTCLGAPFYAGWGLTQDRGTRLERRVARVDVVALVHAVLIAYPRYFDPVTGRACPPEVVLERLASGSGPRLGAANRALSKLQGLFASFAPFWR